MEIYSEDRLDAAGMGQIAFENSDAYPKIIEERYDGEANLMNCISRGDLKACIELKRSGDLEYKQGLMDDIYKRYPTDSLRSCKNAMVVLNTLCRVSARKGGVTPFVVNCISHKYALIIEHSPTIEFLRKKVEPMMLSDYCLIVQNYSIDQYSPATREIATYIVNNLPSTLTVELLAEKFFLHPSSLSRKFKRETGVSVTEFINRHRIKLAQYYLEQGYKNITDISFMVGYKDSNYFCRVFKRITLITPTQYMEHTKTNGILI